MALLDAEIVAQSPRGERRIGASGFVRGPLTRCWRRTRSSSASAFRRLSAGARWGHCKFSRKPGEFAEAIGAVVHDPERGVARAVIGATGDAPHVVADARAVRGALRPRGGGRGARRSALQAGSYERQVHLVALKRAAEQCARPGP